MFTVDNRMVSLSVGGQIIPVHWLVADHLGLKSGCQMPAAFMVNLIDANESVIALQRAFLKLNDTRVDRRLREIGL